MIKRFLFIVSISVFLPTCNAMSASEATFRCKSSIGKAEDTYSKLDNPDLKKIAKAAISIMEKILDEISHGSTFKNLPIITRQCIQHAEHVAWLNEIAPAVQTIKSESKAISQKSAPEPESKKSKFSDKKTKRPKNKLEKTIQSEKDLKPSDASKSDPAVLAPSL